MAVVNGVASGVRPAVGVHQRVRETTFRGRVVALEAIVTELLRLRLGELGPDAQAALRARLVDAAHVNAQELVDLAPAHLKRVGTDIQAAAAAVAGELFDEAKEERE
jgi:hypothetical protein